MDYDQEVERDVDSIINQIRNQSRSLKQPEKEKPELKKEDLEKFVIENASAVVLDSVEMIQALKDDIMTGADAKMVESVSELVKATTAAIESLSKLKLSDDKIKSQKEIKQMEIQAKSDAEEGASNSGLFISREELLKHLMMRKEETPKEDPNTIDV